VPQSAIGGAMARRTEDAGQRGFTLLEMLVALAVLGILVVGLTQGVRTGLTLWNAQARRVADAANLDAAARTVRAILTAMQPPASYSAVAEGETSPDSTYYADHLSFVSDLPTGLGGTQRADITLELRRHRLVLRWTPHRHEATSTPPAAPTETELVSAVDRLELAYWGRPSPDASAGWQQQWSGPGLPELIRVRLVFAKGDLRRWPGLIAAPLLWSNAS
jgi:general secretion pathway protein J